MTDHIFSKPRVSLSKQENLTRDDQYFNNQLDTSSSVDWSINKLPENIADFKLENLRFNANHTVSIPHSFGTHLPIPSFTHS